MGTSHKKAGMELFENVDEIGVYKGNSNDDKEECDVSSDGERKNEILIDTNLNFTPTVINEDGVEFVIFNDDIVEKGSAKWKLTICGQFVGCGMSENELRYNIKRMWSRYGLIDAQMDRHGYCFFKFKNQEGMEEVLSKSPWIVSNKPMYVQKWDPMIGMKEVDVTKIPVWAKLIDLPLEAWTKEGISALASGLGKPIRMDNITAQVCNDGRGRAEYARVLVEFDATKGFKDEICVQYRSKDNVIKDEKCIKSMRTKEGDNQGTVENKETIDVGDNDGFTEVKQKKNFENRRNDRFGFNQWGGKRNGWNRTGIYRRKEKEVVSNVGDSVKETSNKWTIQDAVEKAASVSKNKFAPLDKMGEKHELNILKDIMILDQYLNKNLQPTCAETSNWSKDMISYFKQKWNEDRLKEAEVNIEKNEDVLIGENIAAQKCSANDVNGEESSVLY
ncbi:RNA-directed DNA polymerase, eukaryota, reverse transcriptase zinc-binding domain protein [Tanacetum coccineum]|uniref:RNA-directed DNA polymerase, eukaryota, reverse transcriptase zinc-binding domain protein n=1 Tax=Tanacetum coccineum TaxID=301880 RepID=A0ABQ5C1Q1_9ASTR